MPFWLKVFASSDRCADPSPVPQIPQSSASHMSQPSQIGGGVWQIVIDGLTTGASYQYKFRNGYWPSFDGDGWEVVPAGHDAYEEGSNSFSSGEQMRLLDRLNKSINSSDNCLASLVCSECKGGFERVEEVFGCQTCLGHMHEWCQSPLANG